MRYQAISKHLSESESKAIAQALNFTLFMLTTISAIEVYNAQISLAICWPEPEAF